MRSRSGTNGFSPVELRKLRALKTPAGVQRFSTVFLIIWLIPPGRREKFCRKRRRIVLKEPFSVPLRYVFLGFPPLLWDSKQ